MISEGLCKDRLKDKVAIITGASKGIGRGIAQVFAREGAQVILVSRTEAELKKIVDDITKSGGKATYMIADVTKIPDAEHGGECLKKLWSDGYSYS